MANPGLGGKAESIHALIIRDRLLDFIEKASKSDLKIVGDSWFDATELDCKDYVFTHDRYMNNEQVEQYRKVLDKTCFEKYIENPVKFFFRDNQFQKGIQIEENNRIRKFW